MSRSLNPIRRRKVDQTRHREQPLKTTGLKDACDAFLRSRGIQTGSWGERFDLSKQVPLTADDFPPDPPPP